MILSGGAPLAALATVLLVTSACPTPAIAAAAGPGVALRVTADEAVYTSGAPISLTLRLVNRSEQPITLTFRTSQRYDVRIEDPQAREVWRWAEGRMFAEMIGEETLRPAQELTYRLIVRTRLSPGRYRIVAAVPAEAVPLTASLEIGIR